MAAAAAAEIADGEGGGNGVPRESGHSEAECSVGLDQEPFRSREGMVDPQTYGIRSQQQRAQRPNWADTTAEGESTGQSFLEQINRKTNSVDERGRDNKINDDDDDDNDKINGTTSLGTDQRRTIPETAHQHADRMEPSPGCFQCGRETKCPQNAFCPGCRRIRFLHSTIFPGVDVGNPMLGIGNLLGRTPVEQQGTRQVDHRGGKKTDEAFVASSSGRAAGEADPTAHERTPSNPGEQPQEGSDGVRHPHGVLALGPTSAGLFPTQLAGYSPPHNNFQKRESNCNDRSLLNPVSAMPCDGTHTTTTSRRVTSLTYCDPAADKHHHLNASHDPFRCQIGEKRRSTTDGPIRNSDADYPQVLSTQKCGDVEHLLRGRSPRVSRLETNDEGARRSFLVDVSKPRFSPDGWISRVMNGGHRHIPGGPKNTDQHLKLHLKRVPKFLVSTFTNLIEKHKVLEGQAWKELTSLFEDEAAMKAVFEKWRRLFGKMSRSKAGLTENDIVLSLAENLIREEDDPIAYMVVFTVTEEAKQRRRRIDHSVWLNDIDDILLQEEPMKTSLKSIPFATIEDVKRKTTRHAAYAAFDIEWWYGHLAIEAACARYLAFEADHQGTRKTFIPLTAPTGARRTPFIAGAILKSMVLEAAERAGIKADGIEADYDLMIDNVRLLSNLKAVRRWSTELQNVANEYNVSLVKLYEGQDEEYEFLGANIRHCPTRIRPLKKHEDKMKDFDIVNPTLRVVMQLFGVLMWLYCLLDLDKGQLYFFVKFLRRRLRKATLDFDEPADLWPSLIPGLSWQKRRAWPTNTIIDTTPTYHRTAFSDASDDGLGVVIMWNNKTLIHAEPWSPAMWEVHINGKEFVAVLVLLEQLLLAVTEDPCLNENSWTNVVIHVDNTSALAWASSGRFPRSDEVARWQGEARRLQKELEHRYVTTEFRWIKSSLNIADAPSRLFSRPRTATDNGYSE